MVVISSAIIVISVVSVYEYYSTRNWQQVTSQSRNNIVFEKRNKAYGAYVIRQNYDRRLLMILATFLFGISVSYGSYRYLRAPLSETGNDPSSFKQNTISMIPMELEKKEKPKPEKPETQKVKTAAVLTPIVVNKPVDSLPAKVDTINAVISFRNSAGDTITNGKPPGTGGGGGGSDTTSVTSKNKEPEVFPDIDARFPGGEEARIAYIIHETVFPEEGYDYGGKCYLRFVVTAEGKITNVKVEKGVPGCESCDREAVRVARSMPDWKPAETRGKKVASYFRMVINFLGNK